MAVEFSPKQKTVWQNTIDRHHRWNISCGAVRSGKTYLDYWKVPWRIRHAGEGLILLLGNTKGTLERNILDPLRTIWTPSLVGHVGSNNKVRLFGRETYALGADKVNQVSKLQGAGLVYCYGDEITTWHPSVFDMLKSRLDKPGACFDGTCNPDSPEHWVKKFIDSDADVYSMSFKLDDNPFLSPEFVASLKREYAGTILYNRFIEGDWVVAEGLVYRFFNDNPERFLLRGPTIGMDGQFFVSIDYGTVNPMSMGLWVVRGQQSIRLKEYYHDSRATGRQLTDEEYYAALEELTRGYYIRKVIVDPSAASFITTIRRHGKYSVWPAENSVLDGIRVTATLLNSGMVKIHEACKDAIREFGLYRWDEEKHEDAVIKENDHACVTGDTLIKTEHGDVRIDQLSGNEHVASIDDNGYFCYNEIIDMGLTAKAAPVFEIEMEDGSKIRITGNHPVFTKRGWVKVEQLLPNDEILMMQGKSMIVYQGNHAYIDGYTFTLDKKTGFYLSTKAINGHRMRLHVYMWAKHKGPAPKGFEVHHKDQDHGHNEIDNLELQQNRAHQALHGEMLTDGERLSRAVNVVSKAVPAARAWHGTAAGAAWHSEHAKETMKNLQPSEFICENCGNAFYAKPVGMSKRFCSNKCKAAVRRKSGVDNITKTCERCGGAYIANKYQRTKWCDVCGDKKHPPGGDC